MPSGDDQVTVGFTVPPSLSAVSARYDLLAEIGRGGMGIVYKARDRQTGALVAVKALHPSIATDPQLVERFTNELLIARRITHKNVCRVYDLTDFAGTTVITMELVEGRSLRDMLHDVESVSIRQGLKIARQIAAGLGEAHAQGIVHRDLKPENILISRDGVVKVMDFGIARLMDSRLTATGQLLGTPAYMSPEQAEGKPADARSDIYSLGLVLYEMFCGRPAFSGGTPVAMAARQVHETPVPPRALEADLPVRIDDAIRRCLEKHPDKRFQSVAALEAALADGATSDADTAPAPAAAPEQLTRWQRSDWALVAAAALALMAFFPIFDRVSLAPRNPVSFDRSLQRRIATEHLERLGVGDKPVHELSGVLNPGLYAYVAKTRGAAAARNLANNPVHYWTWSATFDGGSLEIDNRGRLTSFVRTPVPVDPNVNAFDDARRRAAAAIDTFFGKQVSSLQPEHETRGQVYGFAWLEPANADGIRMRYTADVDKLGVSALSAAPEIPSEYGLGGFPYGEVTMNEWGMPVAVVIGVLVCAFGFANRRRVGAAGWRTALAAASFVAAAGYQFASYRFFGVGEMISVPAGMGLLFATAVYFGAIAVEVLLRRGSGWKLQTFTALFSAAAPKDSSGLAIVRGCAIGLMLLGLDTAALWASTTRLGGRLSLIHVGLLGGLINGVAWPVTLIVGICAVQIIGFSLLVAFTDAVASRLPVGRSAGLVAAAVFLAASGIRLSMATVQPWTLVAGILLFEYALLVAVFRRFDLLTLAAAIGTFAFWWGNYPLLVMQQPTGATAPWTAFVVWALIVTGATVAAFERPIRSAYRRIAAAVD